MKSLKLKILSIIRDYLFKYYKREFSKIVEEVTITQKEHIISVIHEAEMREIPIIIELNPLTALGIANVKVAEEEEPKKENPFKIVKNEDDE